jgi:hypothetical protein
MKLKHLLFFMLLFSSLSLSFCQTSWLKDDAQWVYRLSTGGPVSPLSYGYEIITPRLDTIVDSMSCKIYERYVSFFSQESLDTVEFFRDDLLLCEQEDRIFFYDSLREDFFMIYDFNLPIDTFVPYYQYSGTDQECPVDPPFFFEFHTWITDTFSLNIDGVTRRAQEVSLIEFDTPNAYGPYTIIEGMGMVEGPNPDFPRGYIVPGLAWPCIIDFGWSVTPCSYSDNEIEIQFQDEDCFFLESTPPSSTKNILSQNLVEVFPNPSYQTININSLLSFEKIEIQNLQGQSLLQQTYQNELDVSAFANGMYLLVLYTNTGKKVIKRIVKN